MRVGKLFAIVAICGFLSAQLWTITVDRGGWYWPFVDYPMYSLAQEHGAAVKLFELRAWDCSDGSGPEVVENRDLGIEPYRFWELLDAASRPGEDRRVDPIASERDSRAILADLMRERLGPRACEAQVWARVYRVGVDPPDKLVQPFTLVARWRVAPGDGA